MVERTTISADEFARAARRSDERHGLVTPRLGQVVDDCAGRVYAPHHFAHNGFIDRGLRAVRVVGDRAQRQQVENGRS